MGRSVPGTIDLRLPALAILVWVASLLAHRFPPVVWLVVGLGALGWVGLASRRRRRAGVEASPTAVAWVVAAATAAIVASLHAAAVRESPVTALAHEQATVIATVRITSDPRTTTGRFADVVTARATLVEITGRGRHSTARAPVLLIGSTPLAHLRLGSVVELAGRLAPPDSGDLAGVLLVRGSPHVVAGPSLLHRGADSLRAAIRQAVAGHGEGPRALVPALVDGDDGALPADVETDFRTVGLTHLLAVSGTNLTLVVGFLLLVARGLGARARALPIVGAFGVAGFVLLARAEPSVVRAAAMGSVALLGMGAGGRARGSRAWGAAVVVLLLFDPWLAASPGFALSALATAGILFLAPPWRDALTRWLPRWLAEAIAVPLAAQVVCTPIVAALSGQVSLVAVAANLAAAPAVGPATVLGLCGGVLALVWGWLGAFVAAPAAWSAAWIIAVARRCAGVTMPALDVPTSAGALALLTVVTVLLAVGLDRLLERRGLSAFCALGLVIVVLVPLPTPGWPPDGWVLVACDVGQGDGLVLRTAPDEAMVVDAAPEAAPMKRCLDRLGIERVPVVVLTHFHADHIDGLSGVLDGRAVGQILVSPYDDPAAGADQVRRTAAAEGVPVRPIDVDEAHRTGAVRWQVLAPREPPPEDSASPPNDASVVLLIEVGGVRLLLTGDEESGSQAVLHHTFPDLRVDVLKVAHHGSATQDYDLLAALHPRLALISVGADNDYGHPAPKLLQALDRLGVRVGRTDRQGDLAVVVDQGTLRLRTRR